MKATYYEPWATNEERLRHKPSLVSDADWRWLVQFWSSEKAQVRFNIKYFFLMIIYLLLYILHLYLYLIQDISKRNKKNRAKQKINHTSGSKSFAQLHYEQVSTSILIIILFIMNLLHTYFTLYLCIGTIERGWYTYTTQ